MIGVGLDVGGTKILGVAVDDRGELLSEHRRATVDDGAGLLDDLADLYADIVADLGSRVGDGLAGEVQTATAPPLGVGVPGLVSRTGRLVFAPNLRGASGTEVADGLRDRLAAHGPAVQVDNDATCAAAGESAFGSAVGESDVLFVTLGTGIGGGIVSGGRIIRGGGNFAGEIGHFVVDPHGPPCGCGRRGCWERYASGSGLGRIARDAALAGRATRIMTLAGGDADEVRGEHVFLALGEGDDDASVIMDEFAWWLALGLANLANVLDPSIIVIGGGLVRAGEALMEPVRRAFFDQVEGASRRPSIGIVAAKLGDRGGAIGAAVIGLEASGTALLSP